LPGRLTAACAAAVIGVATGGCGGGAQPKQQARAAESLGPGRVTIVARASLTSSAPLFRALPRRFAVSADLGLQRGSTLEIDFGSRRPMLTLQRGTSAALQLRMQNRVYHLRPRPGWPAPTSHLEITNGQLAIDGRPFPLGRGRAARLALRDIHGRAELSGLIISDSRDRASLLLHRLAELHARVPAGALLLGADRGDKLHYGSIWTSGFLAGALWQAASLLPAGNLFRDWALAATLATLGRERTPDHDVGFIYGQSSLNAWRQLCRGAAPPPRLCSRLRRSVLTAAEQLAALAAGNPGAGTIPTGAGGPTAETIVDSMMNIGILPWASRVAHQRAFATLASHQAHVIGSLLVRPDGSTYQAVHFQRATGRIVFVGTHQGVSDNSTWARGEGWGLYGFAQAAAALHDGSLLTIAQRLAGYVNHHVPTDGLTPWDYDAPGGVPVDLSAGVISAAGLLHLVAACRAMSNSCSDTTDLASLAHTLLGAALQRAKDRPPLGLLAPQVLNGRRRGCCNGGELIFGLTYALEALSLERKLVG
jgi:hypothetical protein